jgi:hypothetical protein
MTSLPLRILWYCTFLLLANPASHGLQTLVPSRPSSSQADRHVSLSSSDAESAPFEHEHEEEKAGEKSLKTRGWSTGGSSGVGKKRYVLSTCSSDRSINSGPSGNAKADVFIRHWRSFLPGVDK